MTALNASDAAAAAGTVVLCDGRLVCSSSPDWLAECQVRQRHVDALLHMRGQHMRHARQRYLAEVEAKEGPEAARRLKAVLLDRWGVLKDGAVAGHS